MVGNFAYFKTSEVALSDRWWIPYNDSIKFEAGMNISPFLSSGHPCDQTLRWAIRQLVQAGLRPVQTFDLHTARAELRDCSCPHHGTEQCDCQMVVLLVYGKTAEPVTLILHGNNGLTWLSIAESVRAGADPNLPDQIKQVLQKQALSLSVDP